MARKLAFGRKLLLFAAAMLVVVFPDRAGLVHAAAGQTTIASGNRIEGSWQGTVHGAQQNRRLVVEINKGDSGSLSATVIMLDMVGPGGGVPRLIASSIIFAGDELKFSLGFPNASFDGKMSTDHNSIDGSWTGQQGTQRLLLARATPDTAWAIPQPLPRMKPMAPDANPGIEVATIKPSKPGQQKVFRIGGGRLMMSNVSLQGLITFAYDLEPKQIMNGPSWMNSDTCDVEVLADQPGQPSIDQWRMVVQKLLADRFRLKLHQELRVQPAYMLIVAKGGPKMTKSAIQTPTGPGPGALELRPGTINAQAISMADFVRALRSMIPDRPVIDQTGLSGLWDMHLKWTPDESQLGGMMRMPPPPSGDEAAGAPPLLTSIQEQLGLKLEAGKARVPVLVLDNVEQPSPN